MLLSFPCLQAVLCQRAVEAVAPLVSDYSAVSVCHSDAVKEYCQLLLLRYWGGRRGFDNVCSQ